MLLSSLRSHWCGRAKRPTRRLDELVPGVAARDETPATCWTQPIKLRMPVVLGESPLSLDKPGAFEPVERWIECPFADKHRRRGGVPYPLCNSVSVTWTPAQRFEDE